MRAELLLQRHTAMWTVLFASVTRARKGREAACSSAEGERRHPHSSIVSVWEVALQEPTLLHFATETRYHQSGDTDKAREGTVAEWNLDAVQQADHGTPSAIGWIVETMGR